MRKLKLTAFLFKLKLRGDISFENLKKYAHSKGYRVLLTETKEHKDAVAKYNLPECPKAYTYVSGQIKLIVINSKSSPEEIQLYILHEIAHVELGHLDCELLSSADAEIEANTLAYFALKSFTLDIFTKALVLFVACAIAFNISRLPDITEESGGISPVFQTDNNTGVTTSSPETQNNTMLEDATSNNFVTEYYVYVTPTGKKYHTSDCRYVYLSTAIELDLDTAEKSYTPCSVCKP